ncbi:MAG: SpoIIE family protein phosphatase [Epsilonproteobacteria bacterium]|nr:SpoIIE family protein phosphatase [Campylobacterota bacterium]
MNVSHYKYESLDDFERNFDPSVKNKKRALIQVFSGFVEKDEVERIQKRFRKLDLDFAGVTTAGEIYLGRAYKNSLVISVVEFEDSEVEYFIDEIDDDTKFGYNLATSTYKENTKSAILFLSGLTTNGEDVVKAMEEVDNSVIIAGGMAGDNSNMKATYVFNKDKIYDRGGIIATLNGENLHLIHDYKLNWQPFGKAMTITKADKNHLYEIDNMPAVEVYRRYLGERITELLPHSSIEFPLIKLSDKMHICRAIIKVFDDGSVLTIGNLNEGDKVKFAIGNVDLIVNKTKEEIKQEIYIKPDVIFNYSCVGRLSFLQDNVNIELKPFNDIAPTSGFFTYGEIMSKNGKNFLLNESLTFLGLAERLEKIDVELNEQQRSNESFLQNKQSVIMEVLVNLTNRVIQELDEAKEEVEMIYKKIKDSIEFAALLQRSLLPRKKEIDEFFEDNFIFWKPKDIVGGDIYLFDLVKNENEALYMVIDCTGHGVPGAFVTMMVKTIEKEIINKLEDDKLSEISPAKILSYFNSSIKNLLKQDEFSKSNAGFDGGVVYYNKSRQILKFAGAQIPLIYVDENGELSEIKGDKKSVGDKKNSVNESYTEHLINVKEGMKFYMTTDGFIDQLGGDKLLPFGKKRLKNLIAKHHTLPMDEQRKIYMREFYEYKNGFEQIDDITLVGFEIGKKTDISEIFEYEGVITQNVISTVIDNIENSIDNISIQSKISTVAIEILQNIMHYSKHTLKEGEGHYPLGYIKIVKIAKDAYKVVAKNIVTTEDKEKIDEKLKEITQMDVKEIKKRYRELRRSGEQSHEKGGGIGFYEIAKLGKISYEFEEVENGKYYFTIKVQIEKRKKD